MDKSEEVVAEWLRSEGHDFCHLTGDDDPPDFVVDGDIAVEVTTISPPTYRRMFQFFSDRLFKALGAAENGRGYSVFVEYENEKMFETDEGKKKAELKCLIRQKLEAHYRNPYSGCWRNGRRVISLCHGITLEIWPWPSDHPAEYKYTVHMLGASKGEIVIPTLVENIQAAIDKKSANLRIQARAANYREWWLVVTSFHWLDQNDWKIVSDRLVLRAPWKHIIAVNSRAAGQVSRGSKLLWRYIQHVAIGCSPVKGV